MYKLAGFCNFQGHFLISHNLFTFEAFLLTLWEEHTVGVENEVLLKIFGYSKCNVREVRDNNVMGKSAVSTENCAKSGELRSLRHVAYIRKNKKYIQNLIRRPQGKGPFERSMHMWENDIRQAATTMEDLGLWS